MKHLRLPCYIALLIHFSGYLCAQTTPELEAFVFEGSVAIRANSTSVFNTRFVLEQDSTVALDFYFAPDHPANGRYHAAPSTQITGEILLAFPGLPYLEADSLTFSAVEILTNGSVGEYIFKHGIYRGAGDPVDQCPIRIGCTPAGIGRNLWLYFDSDEIQIGALSATSISVFAPDYPEINGTYGLGAYSLQLNALIARDLWSAAICQEALQGRVVILINGLTCIFENGQPANNNSCPAWGEYYQNNPDCAGMLEGCTPQILQLLSEKQSTLACEQWTDKWNHCSTTGAINRTGKVAIGTTGFSGSQLTVKNGTVANRVKVQQTAWGDHVFAAGYPLQPLADVEAHIQQYRHLPGMSSAAEIEASGGLNIGAITVQQQVKIEELFLYLIALEAQVLAMEQEVAFLEFLERRKIK